VKVSVIEIRDVEIPNAMQRAMARQAEAERERRAKVISAQGEFEASAKLSEAAEVLAAQPISVQLRYLQTLIEMSSERTSTIVVPIPVELLTHFGKPSALSGEAGGGNGRPPA
jgi:regulator of protease activity HflC (stomatin/prohibitin superfamily)